MTLGEKVGTGHPHRNLLQPRPLKHHPLLPSRYPLLAPAASGAVSGAKRLSAVALAVVQIVQSLLQGSASKVLDRVTGCGPLGWFLPLSE